MFSDNDPVAFLESMVFRRMHSYAEAVGFKLFYHHVDEDWERAWSFLKEQARVPLDKAITNLDQLKSQFAGNEWVMFFESEKSV